MSASATQGGFNKAKNAAVVFEERKMQNNYNGIHR